MTSTLKKKLLLLGIIAILVIAIILACINPEILKYDITESEFLMLHAPNNDLIFVHPRYYWYSDSVTLLQMIIKYLLLKVRIPVFMIIICSLVGLITALVDEIKKHSKNEDN